MKRIRISLLILAVIAFAQISPPPAEARCRPARKIARGAGKVILAPFRWIAHGQRCNE